MGFDFEHSCSHVAEWEDMFNKTANVIRDEFIVSGLNLNAHPCNGRILVHL